MDRSPRLATLALALALAAPAGRAQETETPDAATAGGESTRERREHDRGFRHVLDIMELVDAPVFTRNSFQLKYEWTQKPAGAAMSEFTLKPIFVWGAEREFAVRLEIPVETLYPNTPAAPTVSGFASLTSTFLWAFFSHDGIRQELGLELQWKSASNAAVGQPWIFEPIYAVAFRLAPIVGLSVELNWQKSFGDLGGYLPVNVIQVKPTITLALPAWFFLSVQDKTSWSLQDHDVGSLLKLTAGRFLTAAKSVVLAVEYETPLDPVAARGSVFMVGAMLSYYFEW